MSIRYQLTLIFLRWFKWNMERKVKPDLAERLVKTAKGWAQPPISHTRDLVFSKNVINGSEVWRVANENSTDKPGVEVIYLHGGAYVSGVTSHHWRFVINLVRSTGCVVHVPLYPRAPAHNFTEAYDFVHATYLRVRQQAPHAKLVFMGDSAGGGLALGFSQLLAECKEPMPSKIVLISPWLDIDLRDESIPAAEKRDPWLSSKGLRAFGKLWAAGGSRDDFRLSPLFGPLSQLPPIHLFIGDRDLFWPDSMTLMKRLTQGARAHTLHAGTGMCHVWPLLVVKEAEQANAEIQQIIRQLSEEKISAT